MKIYIELIFILAFMLIFIFWKIWFNWSRKRLLKKFKPEDDKSRKGGIFDQGAIIPTEQRIDTAFSNSVGYEQPERRGVLPKTDVSDDGENCSSIRKNRSGIRGFLKRRRNRK